MKRRLSPRAIACNLVDALRLLAQGAKHAMATYEDDMIDIVAVYDAMEPCVSLQCGTHNGCSEVMTFDRLDDMSVDVVVNAIERVLTGE